MYDKSSEMTCRQTLRLNQICHHVISDPIKMYKTHLMHINTNEGAVRIVHSCCSVILKSKKHPWRFDHHDMITPLHISA